MNERFKEIRKRYKINQKEMSEILKVAQSQISNIENGASTTTDTIENFYNHFGLQDTIYLLTGEYTQVNSESEIEELYNELNDEYKIVAKYKIKELIKEQQEEYESKGKLDTYGSTDIKTG